MKTIKSIVFCVISLSIYFTGYSQTNSKPIELSVSTIKTELKQNGIQFGFSFLQSLDSLFERQDFLIEGEQSLFLITPRINIQNGSEDAFSNLEGKITGLIMLFDTTKVGEIIVPNTGKTFHTFPISVGVETNNMFNFVNGIAEIGWVPWYQNNPKLPNWIKKTKLGIFVQSGYKFGIDTTTVVALGGATDQSKERINHGLFRVKGSFGFETKSILNMQNIGLVGNADLWYDILNTEIYYTIQGKVRFYLNTEKDNFIDLLYQKGSGAPNFNEGDQFGIGLTVSF